MFADSPGFVTPGGPFLTMATGILIIGAVILLGGVILAAVLYRKGRKGD